ncbi:MAG TPA: hypothetical protein VEC57_07915 [Candidatus Limnocylindrales bacterium]|nr:hypothetical protein [Candidatus Limnocylindrales bacterium]
MRGVGIASLIGVAMLKADVADAQACDAVRILSAGKHYSCVSSAQASAVRAGGTIETPGQPKCTELLEKGWAKADAQGDCSSAFDAAAAATDGQQRTQALTAAIAPDAEATASLCASLQLKAAGKYAACRLKVHQKNVRSGADLVFGKCDDKLTAAFAKAESFEPSDCITSGAVDSVRADVSDDTDEIVALILSTTTTTSTTTTSLPPDGPGDDFESGTLDDSWSVLHPEIATVSVSGGQLHIQINQSSNWYNTSESVLVYKLVTGDFDVHAPLHAAKTSNAAEGPDPQYVLGGLLARDPASTPLNSNFVHVAIGAGSYAFPMANEFKTTDDSSSYYDFQAIAGFDGEVRLVRAGNQFSMHYRDIGAGSWTLLHSVSRPDLAATLQVGMMAYDNSGAVDFTASFDEIVFD